MSHAVTTTFSGISWEFEGREFMVALGFLYFVFLLGFAVILVASIVTYIVSKIIFDKRTNNALTGGNVKQKRMLRPIAITGIVAGVLFVFITCFAAICMTLMATYSTVTESFSTVVEEDMPSADVCFMVKGAYAEAEPDVYELKSTHSDDDITIDVYGKKDENYPTASKYVIICTYTGDSEVSEGEAMFVGGFSSTGTLATIEDKSYAAYSYIWNAEFPGELRISFRDNTGAEVALTKIKLD